MEKKTDRVKHRTSYSRIRKRKKIFTTNQFTKVQKVSEEPAVVVELETPTHTDATDTVTVVPE